MIIYEHLVVARMFLAYAATSVLALSRVEPIAICVTNRWMLLREPVEYVLDWPRSGLGSECAGIPDLWIS